LTCRAGGQTMALWRMEAAVDPIGRLLVIDANEQVGPW
jgi:hypothetical protein